MQESQGAPLGSGEPLRGRSVLLIAGPERRDTLCFSRYAPLLARLGARVSLLVADASLARLLANTPGVAAVHGNTPPPHDLSLTMADLPTQTGTIPTEPYLQAADADRLAWRRALSQDRRLKVGLAWADESDRPHDLTLADLAPLANAPGVLFISLQQGPQARQAKAPPPGLSLADGTANLRDAADLAALIAELDLVITADTAVADLAGGLGRPVWVLQGAADRADLARWYPSMRLFRRTEPGGWAIPVGHVTAALVTRLHDHAGLDPAPALLQSGLAAHRGGQLPMAARVYRQVLALTPGQPDALHLLGLTDLAVNRLIAAEPTLTRAIRADGGSAIYRNSLAELRRQIDQPDAAAGHARQALCRKPDYAEPLVNLAKLSLVKNDAVAAQVVLRRALRLSPGLADGWMEVGRAALALGHPANAIDAAKRAVVLAPATGAGLDTLSSIATSTGGADVPAWHRRSLRCDPTRAQAWRNAGDDLARSGEHDAAEHCLRRAIALHPAFADAFTNLGSALLGRQRPEAASIVCARSIRLAPTNPDPWNNRANALHDLGAEDAARFHYRRAVALNPAAPVSYANLAEAIRSRALGPDDYRACETLCRRALILNPDHASAQNVFGILCLDLRRLDEAEATFRRLNAAAPTSADARFNLSLALLRQGRLREAWEFYESRWHMGEIAAPSVPGRLWNGEPLEGRSILLYAEQGHGDTLQFVRYAPMVAARGGAVRLAVPGALLRLMKPLPGIASFHALNGPIPAGDFHCPLMSLPRAFGTDLDSIPGTVPYLAADATDIARWRALLPEDERLTVGLVWAGDPRPHNPKANAVDRRRSLALSALAPLGAIDGIRFVSLQMGVPAAEARTSPPGLTLIDLMDRVGDFADTAALIRCLDLVITVDTSVAHLAGALGTPVWVLSRFSGCWRWLDHREDSPWYPSMRLFHQDQPGEWAPVVARVAAELARFPKKIGPPEQTRGPEISGCRYPGSAGERTGVTGREQRPAAIPDGVAPARRGPSSG